MPTTYRVLTIFFIVCGLMAVSACVPFRRAAEETSEPERPESDPESSAKEALDSIQIERDAHRRQAMIESFLARWPHSRYVAPCIAVELATIAEVDGSDAAAERASRREIEYPDDPRVLRIVAECLLESGLHDARALELARNALVMDRAGIGPFRHPDESPTTTRERETLYYLTWIRALTANDLWSEALAACEDALKRVPNNDAGLICAIHRRQGDALAGADRLEEAASAYLQAVRWGDPRNRHTRAS
ncbi:hypothetical protein JXA80_10765, partial [bacterium]|nr:hypothetical protein [candidate division CSSED10-310 bacterium]